MSERIVNDPSLHGWVEENGKWVWDASGSGGGAGAGMVISETEPTDKAEGMQWLNPTTGLVLFWDDEKWLQMPTTGAAGKDGVDGVDGVDGLWTDNGGSISYTDGNVGIGTDSPDSKLSVVGDTNTPISIEATGASSSASTNYKTPSGEWFTGVDVGGTDGSYSIWNNAKPGRVMTIDADGNVNIGRSDDIGAVVGIGGETITATSNNGLYIGRTGYTTQYNSEGLYATGHYLINTGGTSNSAMTIDADGNVGVQVTPNPSVPGLLIRSDKNIGFADADGAYANLFRQTSSGALVLACGYQQTSTPSGFASSVSGEFGRAAIWVGNSIKFYADLSIDAAPGVDVTPTERMTIDADGRVDITGSLYVNGSPKIGASDLIETLSTLRASTLDETVDVRQALASACDKLIEKFESMQEVATQEISDE